MKLIEAKNKFVDGWGSFGSQWGINKTMAEIHGLLLVSDSPLCTEDIMEKLEISRGNANTNIRALIDWGLAYKERVRGERREFFIGEKDVWIIATRVIKMRQEKELVPMLRLLNQLNNEDITEGEKAKIASFKNTVHDIENFALQSNNFLTKATTAQENWFWKKLIKLFTK